MNEAYVVCGAVGSAAGSRAVKCSACGGVCWEAPASFAHIAPRVCQDCFKGVVSGHVCCVTEASLAELAEHEGCSVDEAFARAKARVRVVYGQELRRVRDLPQEEPC